MARGNRARRLAAIVLAASFLAPGAWPGVAMAEPPVLGGEDWYASVYGMFGVQNGDGSDEDLGGGVTVSGGFRFNRWLAAEMGGEYAPKFGYERGTGPVDCAGNGGQQSDYFNAWQVTAGGRLYFTNSWVQPFLLGHGGYMNTRDRGGGQACSRHGFVSRLGGGVEVFVSNDFAISILGAYVLPVTSGIEGHDYISIGLGLTWY